MVRFGGHLSTGGQLLQALTQAQELDFNCFQTFIGPNTGYWPNNYSKQTTEQFREVKQRSEMVVAAHSNYFINFCSTEGDGAKRRASIKSVLTQLELCGRLGIDYLVVHPGSHKGDGEKRGYRSLVDACLEIMEAKPRATLLLENTAGGGSTMGKLEWLVDVVAEVKSSTKLFDIGSIGLCFDTTHAWAEGHDMTKDTVRNHLIGLIAPHVEWVHFNMPDPKVDLGSHRDRHEVSWMEGKWPAEVMKDLYETFKDLNVPMVMEADPKHYPTNTMLLEEWGLR